MTATYRPELPELPPKMKTLPLDERGYPVPWFVVWVDGKPDHRIADARKRVIAAEEGRCWLCGTSLGAYKVFVIGPMCAVNRVSSEPPCHRECAEYSVTACPFLTRPHAHRRETGLPEDSVDPPGHMITRNPGVTMMWITKSYKIVGDDRGGFLFRVGEPIEAICYAEGRLATKEEIMESVDTGLPQLMEMAEAEGPASVKLLKNMEAIARKTLGLDETRV